jgi:hypothetical protein
MMRMLRCRSRLRAHAREKRNVEIEQQNNAEQRIQATTKH